MRILAMCGSLRVGSYNRAILKEMAARAPEIIWFDRIGELPHFNPDDSREHSSVQDLRLAVKNVDAVVIASPEYIHGIPGSLKNALDWVVGSGEWDGKRTAIINVTPSANEPVFVRDGLREILKVMSGGHLVSEACFVVTGAFKKFDAAGKITDPELSTRLDRALAALLR